MSKGVPFERGYEEWGHSYNILVSPDRKCKPPTIIGPSKELTSGLWLHHIHGSQQQISPCIGKPLLDLSHRLRQHLSSRQLLSRWLWCYLRVARGKFDILEQIFLDRGAVHRLGCYHQYRDMMILNQHWTYGDKRVSQNKGRKPERPRVPCVTRSWWLGKRVYEEWHWFGVIVYEENPWVGARQCKRDVWEESVSSRRLTLTAKST